MKIKFAFAFIFLLSIQITGAQQKPSVPDVDRIRIAEAFRIGDTLGNRVWKNWDKAPFALLLITPENEFLIRHPKPSKDFTSIGYDSLSPNDVYFRKGFSDEKFSTDERVEIIKNSDNNQKNNRIKLK